MDYATGDSHYFHSNIIKHSHRLQFMNDEELAIMESGDRGAIARLRISWETVARHDKGLIDATNSVVGENDRLFHLGDFCWVRGNAAKIAAIYAKYRHQIKCREIYLLWGNHDPKHFSPARAAIAPLFTGVFDNLGLTIGKHYYFLSHYAPAIWDRRHFGSRALYGHSHAGAEKWLDEIMPGRLSMDCGVDNAYLLLGEYRPFSLDEIENIMSKRSGFGILQGDRNESAKCNSC